MRMIKLVLAATTAIIVSFLYSNTVVKADTGTGTVGNTSTFVYSQPQLVNNMDGTQANYQDIDRTDLNNFNDVWTSDDTSRFYNWLEEYFNGDINHNGISNGNEPYGVITRVNNYTVPMDELQEKINDMYNRFSGDNSAAWTALNELSPLYTGDPANDAFNMGTRDFLKDIYDIYNGFDDLIQTRTYGDYELNGIKFQKICEMVEVANDDEREAIKDMLTNALERTGLYGDDRSVEDAVNNIMYPSTRLVPRYHIVGFPNWVYREYNERYIDEEDWMNYVQNALNMLNMMPSNAFIEAAENYQAMFGASVDEISEQFRNSFLNSLDFSNSGMSDSEIEDFKNNIDDYILRNHLNDIIWDSRNRPYYMINPGDLRITDGGHGFNYNDIYSNYNNANNTSNVNFSQRLFPGGINDYGYMKDRYGIAKKFIDQFANCGLQQADVTRVLDYRIKSLLIGTGVNEQLTHRYVWTVEKKDEGDGEYTLLSNTDYVANTSFGFRPTSVGTYRITCYPEYTSESVNQIEMYAMEYTFLTDARCVLIAEQNFQGDNDTVTWPDGNVHKNYDQKVASARTTHPWNENGDLNPSGAENEPKYNNKYAKAWVLDVDDAMLDHTIIDLENGTIREDYDTERIQ